MFIDYLGWIATGVFVLSYFCRSAAALRFFQMSGATLWIGYGLILGASPVVVANALVFSAAAWTALRARRQPRSDARRDARADAPMDAPMDTPL